MQILKTYISQGSVATHLRCGEIINDGFIANFSGTAPVKIFKNGQYLMKA